jgi:hypothetical protein
VGTGVSFDIEDLTRMFRVFLPAFKQKIEKLKALQEAGMFSDEEFEQERKNSFVL